MRDKNFPMSSTLDNIADTDDYDSVEDFEEDFSHVNNRLNSINANLLDKPGPRLSDRKISNINSSYVKTSEFGYDNDSMTTTEFQEISPELNVKHIRAYNTSYQKPHDRQSQRTSCDDSEDDAESVDTLIQDQSRGVRHTKDDEGLKTIDKNDLKRINAELIAIHEKIVDEYKIFQEKQKILIKRELKLKHDEDEFYKFNKFDFRDKYVELKKNYESEVVSLREELKEKNKENKRLNEAFKTIKQTNETLKNQLNEKQDKVVKLEKQACSMTSRLANLQKLHETCICKPASRLEPNLVNQNGQTDSNLRASLAPKPTTGPINQRQIFNTNILESLAISLDWLNTACLKKSINFNLPINSSNSLVLEKSVKLMPTLAELLIYLNTNLNSLPASHLNSNTLHSCNLTLSVITKYHLTFLEFIYWSLLHFETCSPNQKIHLTATFRRIGEELYRLVFKSDFGALSANTPVDESNDIAKSTPPQASSFVFENNAKNQLLSCFIILRTMTQADYIKNVFEMLRNNLKEDSQKDLYLSYFGTWTVLKWCKLTNQNLLNMAIDVHLLMSVEGKHLEPFLESCSNEIWFSNISIVLKNANIVTSGPGLGLNSNSTNVDIKLVEKMSVLLQKLSKIKSNKKYFEMFSLTKICTDMLHRFNHRNEFLAMNLKSLLFNLKSTQQQLN